MSALLPLNALGSDRFETVVQELLKEVIGNGTITFGAGKDGAREATFDGAAPYPSTAENWQGKWIFQAKFHDISLLGPDKARSALIADIKNELDRVTSTYSHTCDNYILATNVPLTGVWKTGTIDKIYNEILPPYRKLIPNIHVWGADDVSRLLIKYKNIREAYQELVLPGDLIVRLISQLDKNADELSKTMEAYVLVSCA